MIIKRHLLAASALLVSTGFAGAADLTIYNVASMSGAFANFGKEASKGVELAVKERAKAAGLDVKVVTIDTESNAGKAARKVKAIIAKENASLFVGSTLSSTALAVGKEVAKAGGVYITSSGADEITGTECNKGTFRWSAPTFGAVNSSLQPLLDAHPEIKTVYTITPQYVFGEAMLNNTKKVLDKRGLKLVGNSYHSLKEKEFSGYISQAMASKADLLVLLNFGSQATNAIQQAVNFGLKDRMKLVLVWSNGLDHMRSLGPKVNDGIYFGTQYWHDDAAAGNKELVALSKKHMGVNPNYPMASYYQMTKLVLDAADAQKSADPTKIRAHFEGLSYEGITGKELIRGNDHQVEKYAYLMKGKSADKMKNDDDYADIVSKGKYFVPFEETGCKM